MVALVSTVLAFAGAVATVLVLRNVAPKPAAVEAAA